MNAIGAPWSIRAGVTLPQALALVKLAEATATQRVGSRSEHLFPKSLVSSQFATLESPVKEAGVLTTSALLPPAAQVQAVMRWLETSTLESIPTRPTA